MKIVENLNYINKLAESFKQHPKLLQVLIGPRQVGKTTSVLHYFNTHYAEQFSYYNADEIFQSTNQWIIEAWVKAHQQSKVLIIDEIQKVPDWAQVLKGLWDKQQREKTQVRCILLGSSSLSLQKGLSESLAGRFILTKAYHWNYAESSLGYELTWEEYFMFGGYPGSYPLKTNVEQWQNYVKNSIVSAVIEKDILINHTVRSPALFRQCFEILMSYPAQEISYTKLLGQLQSKGNTELIKHYLRLFEGAFLLKELPKFSRGLHRTRSSSPKILPLCPAFYYMQILTPINAKEKGRVFEVMVGMGLVRTDYQLYYWRKGGHEVDFVVTHGKKLWAIEVKSADKKNTQGLKVFSELYPEAKLVIIDSDNYLEFEKDPVKFLNKSF